ncbi:MAG: hypothetical protein ABI550_08640 [Ignavibacteriaceae bacterium]
MNTSLSVFKKRDFKKFPAEYLLFFCFFLILITVKIITGFNGLYGQDSYEYLRYSEKLLKFFQTGENPGEFFWPILYPLCGAITAFLFGNISFMLQLISMFSIIGAAFYFIKLIKIIHPNFQKFAILYTFLFFSLSPVIFRSSLLVMSDSLSLFFTAGSIYHIIKFIKSIESKHLYLSVFFSLASVLTRYGNFVILLIPLLFLAATFIKHFNFKDLFISLIIGFILLLPHLLIHGSNSAKFLNHSWITTWSFSNFFKHYFDTIDGIQNYKFMNLIYTFSVFIHPAFLFCGIVFFVFIRKEDIEDKIKKILAFSVLLNSFFLAGVPFQNLRFLIPSFPLAAVLLFPAFRRLWHKFFYGKKFIIISVILFSAIQSVLIYKLSYEIFELNNLEKNITSSLKVYKSSRDIYTFYINGALENYKLPNRIFNLYNCDVNRIQKKSLVLFNENKFKDQWKNKNPMLNWDFIKINYNLKRLEVFDSWILYEVE